MKSLKITRKGLTADCPALQNPARSSSAESWSYLLQAVVVLEHISTEQCWVLGKESRKKSRKVKV